MKDSVEHIFPHAPKEVKSEVVGKITAMANETVRPFAKRFPKRVLFKSVADAYFRFSLKDTSRWIEFVREQIRASADFLEQVAPRDIHARTFSVEKLEQVLTTRFAKQVLDSALETTKTGYLVSEVGLLSMAAGVAVEGVEALGAGFSSTELPHFLMAHVDSGRFRGLYLLREPLAGFAGIAVHELSHVRQSRWQMEPLLSLYAQAREVIAEPSAFAGVWKDIAAKGGDKAKLIEREADRFRLRLQIGGEENLLKEHENFTPVDWTWAHGLVNLFGEFDAHYNEGRVDSELWQDDQFELPKATMKMIEHKVKTPIEQEVFKQYGPTDFYDVVEALNKELRPPAPNQTDASEEVAREINQIADMAESRVGGEELRSE